MLAIVLHISSVQITESYFQSLRKPILKLRSLELAKALWEATELRLDTDPSHDWTANAADAPMCKMMQHGANCKAKSNGTGRVTSDKGS